MDSNPLSDESWSKSQNSIPWSGTTAFSASENLERWLLRALPTSRLAAPIGTSAGEIEGAHGHEESEEFYMETYLGPISS